MKRRKNVTKRLLTFALSLAMVLTSVNISALTVYAEVGDESVVLEDETGAVDQDAVVETGDTDETEDQDAIDEAGDTDETEDQDATDETGDTNKAEDQDESVVPGDDEETEGPSAPDEEEPSASDVTEDETDAEESVEDVTLVDDETEGPSAPGATVYANDPEPELNKRIGATYDETNGELEFWITTEDEHYHYVDKLYYKSYASKEEANADYIGTNNSTTWIEGSGGVPLTENEKKDKKSHTIKVNKKYVGAYLYYFPTTGTDDHADREDHEYIVVINPNGVTNDMLVPDVPKGLDVKFYDLEATEGDDKSPFLGQIRIGWQSNNVGITGYYLAMDGIRTKDTIAGGELVYFWKEGLAAGDHTITLIAYRELEDGTIIESGAAYYTLSLTADQAYNGGFNKEEDVLTKLKEDLTKLYNDENTNRYKDGAGNTDGIYNKETWTPYAEAMVKAKEVVDKIAAGKANEQEVKDAYNALLKAKNDLKKMTNKDRLVAAIEKYQEIYKNGQDTYTKNSLANLKEALDEAEVVAGKEYPPNKEIDAALDKLEKAAEDLKPKPTIDDLKDAINKYEKELEENEDKYTKDSVDKLKEELENANDVVEKGKDADDDEIENALKDLEDAAKNLKEKPNKSALTEAIKKYEALKEDDYKEDGWDDFKEALEAAKKVEKDENATTEDVENALNDLENAAGNLEKKKTIKDLEDAIEEYENELKENEDKYTKDSVDKLKEELEKAKDLLEKDPPADEDEIEKALEDLKDAADNLKKRPDLKDLEAAIKKCEEEYPEKDKGKYTDNSWADLDEALKKAKGVVERGKKGEDVTEEEIGNALEDLEDAIKDLVKRPTIENLIDAIEEYEKELEENKGKYTEESEGKLKEELEKAKDLLDKNPPATEDEIENALKNLEDAANNLVPKDKVGLWIQEIPSQTYTGSAIKPVIRVYEGTKLLEEKTDYTVSYKNNTNIGTAQVTVKGKRDYGKTKTVTFKIKAKRISDADVTAANIYAVVSKQGTVKDPKVTIKYGNKTLKLNKDYKFEYPDYKDPTDQSIISGMREFDVEGLGNYKGSRTLKYTIYPMPDADAINMSKVKVELSPKTVAYNGKGTEHPVVTVTYKGVSVPSDEYDLSYLNDNKVGKATVTVSAKLKPKVEDQQYYGSKSVTYTVTGTPLKKQNLLIMDDETKQEIKDMSYTYTGSEIKVKKLKVYDVTKEGEPNKGLLLVEGKDYDIAYSKNINAGKAATITLTGKNGYSGKYVQKFTIGKMSLEGVCFEKKPTTAVYTKNKAVPEFTMTYKGVKLREKLDYTVKCANNNAIGVNTAKITITGKGNYEGVKKSEYSVTAPENPGKALYVADIVMPKNVTTDKVKKAVKVYESSTGKALKAGTDYDKNNIKLYFKDENVQDGKKEVTDAELTAKAAAAAAAGSGIEIQAEITLQGNYKQADPNPPVSYTFYLCDKSATTFKILKVATQEYTGKAVKPKIIVQTKDGKKTLTKDKDYKVTYSNNIERGKGKATVTGISDQCRGVKTVTFQIGTRNLSTPGNWFKEVKAATQNLINTLSDFFNK